MKIVIVIEGGVLRNVVAEDFIEVLVKDFDKSAEDELVVYLVGAEINPGLVEEEFEEWRKSR